MDSSKSRPLFKVMVMAEEKRRIALSVANFFQPKLAADHRAKAALPAWVRL